MKKKLQAVIMVAHVLTLQTSIAASTPSTTPIGVQQIGGYLSSFSAGTISFAGLKEFSHAFMKAIGGNPDAPLMPYVTQQDCADAATFFTQTFLALPKATLPQLTENLKQSAESAAIIFCTNKIYAFIAPKITACLAKTLRNNTIKTGIAKHPKIAHAGSFIAKHATGYAIELSLATCLRH